MKVILFFFLSIRNTHHRIVHAILFFSLLFSTFLPQWAYAEEISSSDNPAQTSETPSDLPDTDHSITVTKTEVAESLETVPEIFASTAEVDVTKDNDSAAIVASDNATVDIPKNPEDGVTLSLDDAPEIDIQLPNASGAADATTLAPGVVAYAASNGSANAVQADDTGTVRMLTVIDNPQAPTEYAYTITVPDGGHVELALEGGALIEDDSGEVIAAVDVPWAKDAVGNSVNTWFTTDGRTLTQHIEHNVEGVVYPVTADPLVYRWFGFEFQLTRKQTNNAMLGMAGAAAAGLYIPDPTISKAVSAALIWSAGYAGWVYNRGGCLKVSVTYTGQAWTSHYYGGNCR